jgi:sulfur-oxidizing protein SoxY
MTTAPTHATTRRRAIAGTIGLGASLLWRPARATAPELAAAVRTFTGGAPTRPGRVTLDIEPLVENGNTVPITVSVASPMTADNHVQAIAVFTERNPQPEVAQFTLTPRSGRARVSTHIRLATSQQVVAVARLRDGSYWSHAVDVIVTLAACVE